MSKYILTVILFMFFISCKETEKDDRLLMKEQELDLRERELELKENEFENQQVEQTSMSDENLKDVTKSDFNNINSKFVFGYFIVSKAVFKEFEIKNNYSGLNGYKTPTISDGVNINMEMFTYTYDIQELDNFSEELKYQILDELNGRMKEELNVFDNFYFNKHNLDRHKYDSDQKLDIVNGAYRSKIVESKLMIFDSYKEASLERNKYVE